MLRAFVDDSRGHNLPKVFILAGYISTVERWAAFSDEWQRALEMPPRLKYFKYREALSQKGQFYRWSQSAAIERIVIFRHIVEDFVQAEVAVGFLIDTYQAAYKSLGRKHQNPYYFAQAQLIFQTARNLEKLGLKREPIDFVFDNQMHEKAKALEAFDWAKLRAQPEPPDLLTNIIRNPPSFADDEAVLPLQAADMIATWWRLWAEAGLSGKEAPAIPGMARQIPGMITQYNEAQLRDLAEDLIRMSKLPRFRD